MSITTTPASDPSDLISTQVTTPGHLTDTGDYRAPTDRILGRIYRSSRDDRGWLATDSNGMMITMFPVSGYWNAIALLVRDWEISHSIIAKPRHAELVDTLDQLRRIAPAPVWANATGWTADRD